MRRMAEVYAGYLQLHRPRDRPADRLPRGVRAARQHASSSSSPTTARRARAAPTAPSTRTSSSTASRTTWRRTSSRSTCSARPRRTTTTPTGWAFAFNTPFKLFKRNTWEGGVADPMIVHWPKGIKAKGELRDQYTHCIDIVPTVYECLGLELPEVVKGYTQWPLEGTSFKYSFDDAKAKTQKPSQFYVMLGTRALWRDGWKAEAHPRRRAVRLGPLRRGQVGALPRRRGPLRGATTSGTSTPRCVKELIASGTSRPASTSACRWRTAPRSRSSPRRGRR